jgi:membrane-associated phospholipid phosphatase
MLSVDSQITFLLNGLIGRWPAFDVVVVTLEANELLKGGVVFSALWYAWFDPELKHGRRAVIATMLGAAAAVATAQGLARVLPFRVRPLFDPSLHLTWAIGLAPFLAKWSSFPSDHAAMFGAIVAGLVKASRPLGLAAGVYVGVLVLLPRIVLGFHYTTDVLGGVLLGAVAVDVLMRVRGVWPTLDWISWLADRRPGLFYAGAFLVMFETASLFSNLRALAHVVANLVR